MERKGGDLRGEFEKEERKELGTGRGGESRRECEKFHLGFGIRKFLDLVREEGDVSDARDMRSGKIDFGKRGDFDFK